MRRTRILLWLLVLTLSCTAVARKPKKVKKMARNYLQHAGTGAVSFASDAVLNMSTGVFSASFWLKTTQSPLNPVIVLSKATAYTGFLFTVQTTGVAFFRPNESGSGAVATSTTVVNDDVWHFIVGTKDSSHSARIYVDGALEDTGTGVSKDLDNTANLVTSRLYGVHQERNTGAIDDIRVYKGVTLSAQQVTNLYNSGFGVRVKENGFNKITSNGFYASCDDGSGTTVTGRKISSGMWSDHNGSFTSGDLTWQAGGVPFNSKQLTSDYEEYTFYINRTSKRIQFRFQGAEDFEIREFKILQPQIMGNR